MSQAAHSVMNITTVDLFNEYLNNSSEKALLIDFFASWCGPCKMIAPKIEQLSKEYINVQFIKINVDKMQEIAQEYKISAMPTFVFIKNKQEISRVRGADIDSIINQLDALNASIQTVQQYKQIGNYSYSHKKDINQALKNYQIALRMLQSLDGYLVKHKDIYIALHCNIALMYLKIGGVDNFNNCIRHCNEVLRKGIDPYNEKAFLRKGEAFMSMNQYKNAKSVYSKYMKYDPG
eukprot:UN06979